ncbi:hypothetical protein R1sor_016618 [Riccia sorocarpa]|uniref:Uncharacterized protein n=1 Tax=Riccia sorocarpa TaxID=122646 RepID=A0ABD3HJI8_9MARC
MATPVGTAHIDAYYSYFQTVKKDIVVPERIEHHPSRLYPSNLDILGPDQRCYIPLMFAYRLSDTSDTFYEQFVLGLKQSLAKVLVSFYPAAGGLATTGDLLHPLVFVCDDRGVPFLEAYKAEPMDEIVKNHEPAIPLSGIDAVGLCSNRKIQEITESGIPCVVVQITRFKCGGVCISVSWNHTLADMAGVMLLIKAWADIAGKGETTIVPQIDRTVLNRFCDDETERSVSLSSPEETERAVSQSSSEDNVPKVEIVPSSGIVRLKVLHINKDKIGLVKQAALEDGYVVSTLDCLSAHLWGCVTKHKAASTGTDVTSFSTVVQGRERMSGTLTSNYFGNVIVPALLWNIPTTEIVSRPLGYAASLIRKAIGGITQDTYWGMINRLEEIKKSGLSLIPNDQFIVTSWARFGMYDVDFGCGTPHRFQINVLPECADHGVCIILPGNPSAGGFDVLMYLHSDSGLLERLWADPEFTSLS